MKALDEAEFTIVGTGLMGCSLALALRHKVRVLRGIESRSATREQAAPYFDEITDALSAARTSDVIVLATPVRVILSLLDPVAAVAKAGALILDLGSTKRQIVEAMDGLPDHVLAVGGHPMCGKEQSGPQSAEADLFRGHVFVLCPTRRTTPDALAMAQAIVAAVEADPLILDAARHDPAVAAISHLPYVISQALVNTVIGAAQSEATPWHLAASGFRDTSRLAGSNTTMMGDTLLTNREAVLGAITDLRSQLDRIENALTASDEAALRAILDAGRQARTTWFEAWTKRADS